MDQPQQQRANRVVAAGGIAIVFLAALLLLYTFAPSNTPVLAQTVPQVGFQSISTDVSEGAGTVQIVVSLSVTTTNTVSVNYNSFAGTATGNGVDYTNVSGLLTFNPGTLTQNIAVTIINDSTDEATEFFYIELLNPQNATLGTISRLQINILDNDDAPAPTSTPGGVILLDAYEPNNSFREAFAVGVGSSTCNATFWPIGDLDYFRFLGKSGSRYSIQTKNLAIGIDTVLTVYDTQGNVIATNDDVAEVGSLRSQVDFTAGAEGYYYAYVTNKLSLDPTNKTYCLDVTEVAQPTATASQTPIAGADACEFNSTLEYACTIGAGLVYNLSFVPVFGSSQDTDMFRLWMKPGLEYTCETLNLSPYADTNMIFLDQNGNDFVPNLGNDDKAPGDRGSKLSIRAPYTGYLTIVVGPVNPPPYDESPLHTYDLLCLEQAVTPTPTPTSTSTAVPAGPGSGTGGTRQPTATPMSTAVFPTVTPIDLSSIFQTLTPAPPPPVQIQPLPTATPASGGQRLVVVNVTLYYDSNNNFTPELTEGIMDAAVALYDNNTGQLLAFGYTNEAGMIRFDSIAATGPLRVVVPFLNYNQIVVGNESNILIRVAPQPLPAGIP